LLRGALGGSGAPGGANLESGEISTCTPSSDASWRLAESQYPASAVIVSGFWPVASRTAAAIGGDDDLRIVRLHETLPRVVLHHARIGIHEVILPGGFGRLRLRAAQPVAAALAGLKLPRLRQQSRQIAARDIVEGGALDAPGTRDPQAIAVERQAGQQHRAISRLAAPVIRICLALSSTLQ
jgi:hypothetical protein